MPSLVIAGDSDIFPPAHAGEIFALLNDASSLAILPACTHEAAIVDPMLVAAVTRFLGERSDQQHG